jgi:hypothetical protein
MLPASVGAAVAVLLLISGPASAQAPASDAIQKKLQAEYALTKTTDDKTDIVTAGSVLVLHREKLVMVPATSGTNPCMNTYKDGKLTQTKTCGVNKTMRKIGAFGGMIPGAGSAPSVTTRNFVSGEKFWVTKIEVRNDGVVFSFFTDAINDTRYIGALTIPFGAVMPSPEEALKAAQEIITVAPAEDAKGSGDNQQGAQQPAPAAPAQPAAPAPAAAPAAVEAPPPPLDAPPPPPADPVEVKVGQTPEQVVAALGQPLKKAKTPTKEIYFYKDLKVTFVNGKVKDVE